MQKNLTGGRENAEQERKQIWIQKDFGLSFNDAAWKCDVYHSGISCRTKSIIQFILATKRSDADSKADAVQTAVCGIALMGITLVVQGLGIGKAIDQGKPDTKFDDKMLSDSSHGEAKSDQPT